MQCQIPNAQRALCAMLNTECTTCPVCSRNRIHDQIGNDLVKFSSSYITYNEDRNNEATKDVINEAFLVLTGSC